MREDLLGYLLGALEPDEMQRVARAVRTDPAMAAELERLQAALRPLEAGDDLFEPPADLISRTLGAIDRYDAEHDASGTDGPHGAGSRGAAARGTAARGTAARGAAGRRRGTPAGFARSAGQWRLVDCLATAGAALILAGLVLPGVLRGRSLARQEGCQQVLREGGWSLIQFAMRADDQRFPQVAPEGPEAFAGIYALVLNDAELMSEPTPLWCPSLNVPAQWEGRPIPSVAEVSSADPQRLAWIQRVAGGHYAYSLGVRERGHYVARRYEGRTNFAILADAPMETLAEWAVAHEGRGVNVLFEDGRIRFLARGSLDGLVDHPFLNRDGAVEAGVDPYDAALAPSWRSPFGTGETGAGRWEAGDRR